ncbi:MAG: flagellar C1a complex subunit C1a-32-domain-containing protein [Monoraphidium minutum]|nr:MAG: flagellar C1a complex subunit C1a-32-domain-containing protein [Monoraphidium minutum]
MAACSGLEHRSALTMPTAPWESSGEEQLDQAAEPRAGACARVVAVAAAAPRAAREARVLADLRSGALHQGRAWGLSKAKLPALLDLAVGAHARAAGSQLTLGGCFQQFRAALLNRALNRPPFSAGIFAQCEARRALGWFAGSYCRHYKLYQHAFTDRVNLDVDTRSPWELTQVPLTLPALAAAATEEEYRKEAAQASQDAVDDPGVAGGVAGNVAQVEGRPGVELPEGVEARVQHAVERELAGLCAELEDAFQRQHASLLAKVAALSAPARAAC